jgi:hypothetical protein
MSSAAKAQSRISFVPVRTPPTVIERSLAMRPIVVTLSAA